MRRYSMKPMRFPNVPRAMDVLQGCRLQRYTHIHAGLVVPSWSTVGLNMGRSWLLGFLEPLSFRFPYIVRALMFLTFLLLHLLVVQPLASSGSRPTVLGLNLLCWFAPSRGCTGP